MISTDFYFFNEAGDHEGESPRSSGWTTSVPSIRDPMTPEIREAILDFLAWWQDIEGVGPIWSRGYHLVNMDLPILCVHTFID